MLLVLDNWKCHFDSGSDCTIYTASGFDVQVAINGGMGNPYLDHTTGLTSGKSIGDQEILMKITLQDLLVVSE